MFPFVFPVFCHAQTLDDTERLQQNTDRAVKDRAAKQQAEWLSEKEDMLSKLQQVCLDRVLLCGAHSASPRPIWKSDLQVQAKGAGRWWRSPGRGFT